MSCTLSVPVKKFIAKMKSAFESPTLAHPTVVDFSEKQHVVVVQEVLEELGPEVVDQSIATQAAEIFRPTDASEISDAVHHALENGFKPMLWSYQLNRSNEIQNATLIDLQSGMSRITVDTENNTVTFGSSATIGEVDNALAKHGLAVVGGTCAVLRLGGVMLGGGYGYLSSQYGLVADNLMSATVVLADGRILTASKDENEDLFWGIRGSYTNLGICADFTIQAYPISSVFWGKLNYSFDQLKDVLTNLDHIYHNTLSRKSCISLRLELMKVGDSVQPEIVVYLFHNGEKSAAKEEFRTLLDVHSISSDLNMLPYHAVNRQMNQTIDHNSKLAFCSTGVYIPSHSDFKSKLISSSKALIEFQKAIRALKGMVLGVDYRVRDNKVMERKTEDMSFAARHDGPIMYLRARWEDGSEDQKVKDVVKEFGQSWRNQFAIFQSAAVPGAYPGFCTLQDMTPKETFGPNFEKLTRIKLKYDPGNVFDQGALWKKGDLRQIV